MTLQRLADAFDQIGLFHDVPFADVQRLALFFEIRQTARGDSSGGWCAPCRAGCA